MSVILGEGDFRYRVTENWAHLADGWSFKEVASVGVDRHDNLYVFSRGEHPMTVFDREGNFLRSWGDGLFQPPQDDLALGMIGRAALDAEKARAPG